MGLDANVAASVEAFSVDAQASQSKHMRSQEDAYYALRTSFIPLWTVYLPNLLGLSISLEEAEAMLPDGEFRHEHRREYEQFFARYGTHYVRRAWVGGKASLAFVVDKSSGLSKEGIQAGIKASYAGVGSAGAQTHLNEEKEKLQQSSECQIFGKGGDEVQLALLSSLDEAAYNNWITTIKNIPQVIELDVMGIWNLLPTKEKANALQEAYRAATVFRQISAIFIVDKQVFILRGDKFFIYDIDTKASSKPAATSLLPGLAESRFERIDSALTGEGLSSQGENIDRKIFIFKEQEYIRIDYDKRSIDPGYPKKISEGWPGVNFERIDAAVNCGPDAVYLFSGN